MGVRLMSSEELADVQAMMLDLCPGEEGYDFSAETVFVWERPNGGLGGFASLSLRPWAEGCKSMPVPYVEGWWVAPDLRRTGVGRALIQALEQWCRTNGYSELGSDVELDNSASLKAHADLGFERTLRLQFFRKKIS